MTMIKMFGYSRKFKVNGRSREFITNEAYSTKEEADARADVIRKSGKLCRVHKQSAIHGVGRKYTYVLFEYNGKR